MQHQILRQRLMGMLILVTALIALFSISFYLDVGEMRSRSGGFWSGLHGQWGQAKLTDIWGALNGTLTLLVLIIATTAGYVRFVRRREMHASCGLTLEAKLVPIAAGQAVKVIATVKNEGSYQLLFSPETQQYVDVRSADRVMWDDVLIHGGQLMWSVGEVQGQMLLEAEGVREPPDYLEPGQQLERTLLFPVTADALAFNVRIYVEACPRWIATIKPKQDWSAELILTLEESLQTTSEETK